MLCSHRTTHIVRSAARAASQLDTRPGKLPHPGARLRMSCQRPFTFGCWNTHSLSETTRLQCEIMGLDALGIAETWDKHSELRAGPRYICSEPATTDDKCAGVAIMLSNRAAKAMLSSGAPA